MDLQNINYKELIHNKLKKCEFCGEELVPIGLDYLYANMTPDCIEYQRLDLCQVFGHKSVEFLR